MGGSRSTISGCFRRWRFSGGLIAVDGVEVVAAKVRITPMVDIAFAICRPDATRWRYYRRNNNNNQNRYALGGGKPFSLFTVRVGWLNQLLQNHSDFYLAVQP